MPACLLLFQRLPKLVRVLLRWPACLRFAARGRCGVRPAPGACGTGLSAGACLCAATCADKGTHSWAGRTAFLMPGIGHDGGPMMGALS